MRSLVRARAVALSAAALLLPAVAFASGGEGGGNPWFALGMKFVNFGILVGILYFALRKTVPQALQDRRENIRRALEESRKALEAAQAKLREYKDRVAHLEDEIARLRADFEAEGKRQQERILAEADKAAESIRRQAEASAQSEVKRARDQLRAEAAQLAVSLAEEILRKAYGPEDQKKAVAFTVERVEGLH
ncbi:ATP synthase F0 subunit B [Deferrisoma camini]|uniref:ATP synthase F0 subunit B n=1 Tax=Deferrisoma camini TaxID=1035120 RepID=UPI00046D94A4|nr:ATP synthase F0 subunit B [Deferrisoma camini]